MEYDAIQGLHLVTDNSRKAVDLWMIWSENHPVKGLDMPKLSRKGTTRAVRQKNGLTDYLKWY